MITFFTGAGLIKKTNFFRQRARSEKKEMAEFCRKMWTYREFARWHIALSEYIPQIEDPTSR